MKREDDLYRGMTVVGPDERPLGKIEHIVKDVESRETRFLGVEGRLIPMDAVHDLEKGRVKVNVPRDRLSMFPLHTSEDMPPTAQQDQALNALGLRGSPGVEPRDTDLEPGQSDALEDKTPGS